MSSQGDQNCFKRFIYCCIEKIYSCTISIEQLYDLLATNEDFEFSVGILLRALLMECILVQYLKHLSLQVGEKEIEVVKEEMDKYTLMCVADGTSYLINDFYDDDDINDTQKKEMGEKLASFFPGVFKVDENGQPRVKKEYKLEIKAIYKKSTHQALSTRKTIYRLYMYYSKYDHVSHWSSFFGRFAFEYKKKQLDTSIAMILMNFRDILALSSFDSNINNFFLPTINNIDNHVKDSYPEFNK